MKRFEYKLILIATISFMIALFITETYNIKSNIAITNNRIKDYKIQSKREFDNEIKMQVQNVISLLDSIYAKQKKGEIKETEAKSIAKYLVRQLRYGKEGYFWIYTINGYTLVLPTDKNYEGKNRYNYKDISGKYVIREAVKKAKKRNGGYVDYYYRKLESKKAIPKRSYSILFKPYMWIVGTGSYKDSLNQKISLQEKYYKSQLKSNIINSLLFLLMCSILSIAMLIYFSKRIYSPLNKIIDLIENVTDLKLNEAEGYEKFLKYDNELGDIINATVIMKKLFNELSIKFKMSSDTLKKSTSENNCEFLTNLDNNLMFIEQEFPRIYKNVQDSVLTLSSAVSVLKNKKVILKDLKIQAEDINQILDYDIVKSVKQINAISREIQNNTLLFNKSNTSKEQVKICKMISLYSDTVVHNIFNQAQIGVKILESSDKLYAMAKDLNNMPLSPNLSVGFYELYIKYIEIIKNGINQIVLSCKGIECSIDAIINAKLIK